MTFFAEGLPRLGVINLQLDIQSRSLDTSPTLSTTSHNATATLHHQGDQIDVILPLSPSMTQTFTLPARESIITARIPCLATKTGENVTALVSADDFQGRRITRVCCSSCHRRVVRCRDGEFHWKDLPSDSWGEYSDYWLCHRHTSAAEDTYSSLDSHSHSYNQLRLPTIKAIQGTGLIGLTSLLLHPQDIHTQSKVAILPPLSCHRCALFYLFLSLSPLCRLVF